MAIITSQAMVINYTKQIIIQFLLTIIIIFHQLGLLFC